MGAVDRRGQTLQAQRPRGYKLHGTYLRSRTVLDFGVKHKAEDEEFIYSYILIG